MLSHKRIHRTFSVLLIALSMVFLMLASSSIAPVSAGGEVRMQAQTDTPEGGDDPDDAEEPPEESTSVVTSITQSFFNVVFHDDTISKALSNLFKKTAEAQKTDFQKEVARWSSALNELVKPAEKDQFTTVAKSGLKTAAALAPALFLLRLALYHWSKLLGDGNDTPMVVVGDWLTAGLLAVLSGPFLDLISRLGWWMCKVAAVGETRVLASNFVTLMSAPSFLSITSVIPGLVFLQSLIGIGMTFAAILAMSGLLFAFVSAQATLFVLAVLGPAISVGAVIPQMRWLRSLWLKAVVLISLLPLIAGAIFKAAVSVAGAISQGGMVLSLVRLLWLFGATGALLSLSGILAKMTLSASGEAAKKIFGVAKGLVATAALAAATGGVGAAAGGAAAAGGGAAAGTGATGAGAAATAAGTEMAHLAKSQGFNKLGTALDAVGAHKQARVAYGMARSSDLSARQDRLQTKIDGFGGASSKPQANQSSPASSDLGFSASAGVKKDILSGFGGSSDEFRSAYSGLSSHMEAAGFSPDGFASQYPQAVGMMAKTYTQSQQEIDDATAPLWETANRAGVDAELLSLLEQAKKQDG
ncbi:MAG: hypothetical protein ISR59_03915 [Anaerolineales bacterium]|uniref:Uncharacterized protein n=1 Tax=Candidatus Desulfolinea nitratireducens TaxID=2841698 RepID=A0A8J6NKG6_9CHLR|nr:hypothetical protein [Candidatus Desulfolinea nitratireducens]MBL6960231.1 hypothetical protein [Anaerolineales bacterium]